jgi:hypothetical protein
VYKAVYSTLGIIETYLLLPGGHIDYLTFEELPSETCKDVKLKRVSGNLPFPNGMGLSPATPDAPRGRYIAVALTSSSRLVILHQLDADQGKSSALARRIKTFDLPFLTDNVVWFDTNSSAGKSEILVAGHPTMRDVDKVRKEHVSFAPSHVASIKVTIERGKTAEDAIRFCQPHTVYRSDGDPARNGYSTSTTADRDSVGRLWISGLYGDGLMVCEGGKAERI